MLHHHQHFTSATTRQGSVAVLLVFAIIWSLGAHGFSVVRPDRCAADWLMLSAQLFALHSNIPDNPLAPIPWSLEIARFAAPAFTAGGLLMISAAAGWVFRRVARRSYCDAQPEAVSPGVAVVVLGKRPRRLVDPITITALPGSPAILRQPLITVHPASVCDEVIGPSFRPLQIATPS